MSELTVQGLSTAYHEICRSHDQIAEFRAKLLGLLPLASGTGIFLLIRNSAASAGVNHFIPIGLFGMLITLGLFLYELRGIHKCRGLQTCAEQMEQALLPDARLAQFGAFRFRQRLLGGYVGAAGAALVIYPTVIGAWAYLLGYGLRESGFAEFPFLLAVGLAVGLAFGLGAAINRHSLKQVARNEKKLRRNTPRAGADLPD